MSKKTIPELKQYFQAGERPTENQFGDLIDSYAHLDDTIISELRNSEYTVHLQFPANYQVGDYVEFLGFYPEMALASGFYEISIAYTRSNIASAATHIASVSHANPNIWRECGRINTNNYVGNPNGDGFTIDTNGLLYRFRIRATKVLGEISQEMSVSIKVRSINKNLSWNEMDNRGNDTSDIQLQPMTDQWELLVGSAFSSSSAKIALKADMNGNLGIGMREPKTRLHLNSTFSTPDQYGDFIIGDINVANLRFGTNAQYTWIQSYGSTPLYINSLGNNVIFNKNGGNVGIGTSNPVQKLTVSGNQNLNEGAPTNGQNSTALLRIQSSHSSYGEVMDFGMNVGPSYGWIQPQDLNNPNTFYNLSINPKGGNVGIGTQNPDHKLTVKGIIHAEDIIIDLNVPADYVFQKYYDDYSSIREDYSLMSLGEVESFIKENKHLPEIPSGDQMTEVGLTVGVFHMKLLQKIEELTLYLISQDKEIKNLKSQMHLQ